MAAHWHWFQVLPTEITQYLEEFPHGHGRLDVYAASPLPGADYKEFNGDTIRYVTLNKRCYQAYVYGRRIRQMTQPSVAVHGGCH